MARTQAKAKKPVSKKKSTTSKRTAVRSAKVALGPTANLTQWLVVLWLALIAVFLAVVLKAYVTG